jgi:hypothetical protein
VATRGRPRKAGAPKVKITLVMEEQLWEDFRVQALREKTTASEILGKLAADYLRSKKKGGQK